MKTLLRTVLLGAVLSFPLLTSPRASAQDDYWNNHWSWYDNTYQPYYYRGGNSTYGRGYNTYNYGNGGGYYGNRGYNNYGYGNGPGYGNIPGYGSNYGYGNNAGYGNNWGTPYRSYYGTGGAGYGRTYGGGSAVNVGGVTFGWR